MPRYHAFISNEEAKRLNLKGRSFRYADLIGRLASYSAFLVPDTKHGREELQRDPAYVQCSTDKTLVRLELRT